ncbi:hypothetical protein HMPREF9446_02191 [Bacteroides fluxus YIT 12057]|uniref:Uncharacterized protein n=1 Tax=Bacteroides fluxus YIT 12057 TaxID=763034 RepID=F3PTX1_9BACE|nr:hypothetical protein HMPREF9446_02191 [Bacteroides fluxus YIT 12057]
MLFLLLSFTRLKLTSKLLKTNIQKTLKRLYSIQMRIYRLS